MNAVTLASSAISITPSLWFDGQAEEAARFYAGIFPNSGVDSVSPMMASFHLAGQKFIGLNGGPHFKFNEAVSFFVSCDTQEEVDYFWTQLLDGGEESQCGWLKDRFGLSWQVVPRRLGELLSDDDSEKADRVLQAMLKMRKLDIATLQRAYDFGE